MEKKGLSQEALKSIACITMLLDHIGATMVRGYTLRIIGRIAFPIFCFLMAEGAYHTKNPRKYCLRLMIGMLLSELPFDLASYSFVYVAVVLAPTWLLSGPRYLYALAPLPLLQARAHRNESVHAVALTLSGALLLVWIFGFTIAVEVL